MKTDHALAVLNLCKRRLLTLGAVQVLERVVRGNAKHNKKRNEDKHVLHNVRLGL